MNESTKTTVVPTPESCPMCHASLPQGALGGLCPGCLLAQGVSAETATQHGGQPFEAPPVADLAKLFPNLEILRLLGKGGMGAVYQARQPALDRMVALKIIPAQNGKSSGLEERFVREARALARLQHPNIVALHEFGQAGEFHFFIMEYVDGLNLRQLQRSARLAPRAALDIVPQICEALQYAHDQGVVHRDIKPENVLVTRDGKVKIADFGIAKIVTPQTSGAPLTAEGQIVGTPHYMAPEQVERPSEVDHRADIFSLGVVFYEMLTGELPMGKFPPPSRKVQVDIRLDEIVMQALEKEPHRRYQHASEVSTQIQRLSEPGRAPTSEVTVKIPAWQAGVDYKSKATVWGLPLLHVATGLDPATGKRRVAKGIIAIGNVAFGWVALGGVAFGGVALGGVAAGGLAFGGLGLGIVAAAGLAVGLLAAFGGGAVAPVAIGGGSLGYYGFGGGTLAQHGFSGLGVDPQAWDFFYPWIVPVLDKGYPLFMTLVLLSVAAINMVPAWLQRNDRSFTRTPAYWVQIILPLGLIVFLLPVLLLGRPKLGGLFRGLISGVVVDAATGEAVAGAKIRVGHSTPDNGLRLLAQNRPDGRFSALLKPGKTLIQVSAENYATQTSLVPASAFDRKAHAQVEFKLLAAPKASIEHWSPTVEAGQKPAPSAVLDEAKRLRDEGKYEDSLQRFIWFFNHEAEYEPSQSGLRLSFCLMDWMELARRYPKARTALEEIRDRGMAQFKADQGCFALFQEVSSINSYLGEEEKTLALFKEVMEQDEQLAGQVYPVVQDLLIQHREFGLCRKFMGDPMAAFDRAVETWKLQKRTEENTERMMQSLRERAGVRTAPSSGKYADRLLINSSVSLIEILVGSGELDKAKALRDRALGHLQDPRLVSAVEDAQKRVSAK